MGAIAVDERVDESGLEEGVSIDPLGTTGVQNWAGLLAHGPKGQPNLPLKPIPFLPVYKCPLWRHLRLLRTKSAH